MSLFDKEELLEFLEERPKELIEEGHTPKEAKKITRKEFISWLGDHSLALMQQLRAVDTLPPEGKEERREKAANDFHFFRTTYFPHYYFLEGKSVLQADLEVVYHEIADRPRGVPGNKYAEAAPRGFGKSTDVSVVFLIWIIVRGLRHFPTLFSDAIELTETLIESVKTELEENGRLKADYPDATGVGPSWKVGDIITRNGIRVKGFGSGKRVRGIKHGVHRPDLALLDDLENDTNVKSREQRDKLEAWIDDAVSNLGSVDGNLDIIYIGTILHNDSVLARKLKLAYWNPKRYQAIIRFPDRMDLWNEYAHLYKSQGVDAAHNFYAANKADMDSGAKLLWPEAIPLETLMRKWAENPRSFYKELQNNPKALGTGFVREKMHFYTNAPANLKIVGWVDPAGNKKKSDYTSITVLGVCRQTYKAYVLESINKVQGAAATILEMIRLQELYKVKQWRIEDNFGGDAMVDWTKEKAADKGVHIIVRGHSNTENKEERIEELVIPIEDGDILIHESMGELINQLEDFPDGANDDAPDSLVGAWRLSKAKKKPKGGNKRNRKPQPQRKRQSYGGMPS